MIPYRGVRKVPVVFADILVYYDAPVRPFPFCVRFAPHPTHLRRDSIRFEPEILHGANAGLSKALKYLTPIKVGRFFFLWERLAESLRVYLCQLFGV